MMKLLDSSTQLFLYLELTSSHQLPYSYFINTLKTPTNNNRHQQLNFSLTHTLSLPSFFLYPLPSPPALYSPLLLFYPLFMLDKTTTAALTRALQLTRSRLYVQLPLPSNSSSSSTDAADRTNSLGDVLTNVAAIYEYTRTIDSTKDVWVVFSDVLSSPSPTAYRPTTTRFLIPSKAEGDQQQQQQQQKQNSQSANTHILGTA
jgi:hypothetical protein